MYRNGMQNNYNRIEITITADSAVLNNQKTNALQLEQKVYAFIKKYAPNYVIILNSDDEITYQQYIGALDILWTQVDRLRNELSMALYSHPYDFRHHKSRQDTIRRRFPRNFIEWSQEEQRLNALIKKAGNKH